MNVRPEKAYKNLDFLSSPAARHIRILCEYEEVRQRLMQNRVRDTIVFFGSARTASTQDARAHLDAVRERAKLHPKDSTLAAELHRAELGYRMSSYYDGARELARKLTAWSMERNGGRRYVICSGGGPGIMEAANRGAADVPNGKSIGLGISLPFEQGVNGWVNEELAFEFHYFFTRKYWFLYPCKGLVIFPGGFGTLDELFETLTLVQTGKIKKRLPVVLFGSDYWNKVLNLEAMAEYGTISHDDLQLIHRTDDVDEAFQFLSKQLSEAEENEEGSPATTI